MSASGAKHFEDVEEGETITTATPTMSEADIRTRCSSTGDWNQRYSSVPVAASHVGRRVFAVPQVFASAVGLVGRTNAFEGTVTAILGFDDFTFRVPLHRGYHPRRPSGRRPYRRAVQRRRRPPHGRVRKQVRRGPARRGRRPPSPRSRGGVTEFGTGDSLEGTFGRETVVTLAVRSRRASTAVCGRP